GCTSTLGVAFSNELSALNFMNAVLTNDPDGSGPASKNTEVIGLFVDVNNYVDKFDDTICGTAPACDCNYSILWDSLARIGNHTLYDYGKPSIVLSLELENDELAGGCWSNENVSSFYKDLYANRISQLAGSGIIGLSLACLQDGHCYPYPPPPLAYYGLLDSTSIPKDPQYLSWFDACGRYYFNSEGIIIDTFSAKPTNSTACDGSRLMALYQQYKCYAE
ncbi:MAG: hypothetical protein NT157_04980, partial [Candidatus Micrarchaeota archaeon]|nr:hypothetical protein [Candidatus Micrarchaeota archaeon]